MTNANTLEGMELIRTLKLTPYKRGMGPRFILDIFDGGAPLGKGPQWTVGYRLVMKMPGRRDEIVLFEGADYGCSPLHAIDSDESLAGLISFLCLQPGDTDSEYFKDYSQEQIAFAHEHGTALLIEAEHMLGEEAFA